jgi:uncharacterized membrane protein YcfT
MRTAAPTGKQRIDWVDYAKGLCIVMVVAMHSTFGVENATGTQNWMHFFSVFTQPFRMPDFFLISGLFLARVIDRDWGSYLDRRVWHFVYFYVLWLSIQLVLKAPGLVPEIGVIGFVKLYLYSYIDPFGTLWFIYLLPVFFFVTKLVHRVPPLVVFLAGVALETARIHSGNTLIDEFAARFLYFFAGYWLGSHFFVLARAVQEHPWVAGAALLIWAPFNGLLVATGLAFVPGVSLFAGFLGAAAVIAIAALLSKVRWLDLLRYAGEHSLTIYLAFFLPMAAARYLLLKTGLVPDLGLVSLLVTAAAVTVPLLLRLLVKRTPLFFLFERPTWAKLDRPRRPALQAAE